MKKIICELTPPLLWKSLKRLKSLLIDRNGNKDKYIEWEYMPDAWQTANNDPKIKGWDVESVLEAYKSNWSNFLQTLEGTFPLGMSPESSSGRRTDMMFHNLIMTFAYALALASRYKSSISMLDWGGGIGHYYLISQHLVPELKIDYHCKDVPTLANYGKQLFPQAHFYEDETCLDRKYDFILVSGSLHYAQDWAATLRGLAQATSGYLLVTRLPVVQKASSYVMVQRPYQYGYDTEYLGWCLNYQEFLDCAETLNLHLVREFVVGENPLIHHAPEQCQYWGFLFKSF